MVAGENTMSGEDWRDGANTMSGEDWRDEFYILIADCRKRERSLSAWDADFLDSIEERLDDAKPLSEKQIECLEEIWSRATAKG
jgi:hypothetical protein